MFLIIPIMVNAQDFQPPFLTIDRLPNNAHVNTMITVLRGTATDAGRGWNGIYMVTVQATETYNDTEQGNMIAKWPVQGNLTAMWYSNVVLQQGENHITVQAYDNAIYRNVTAQTITIYCDAPLDIAGPELKIDSHRDQEHISGNPDIVLTGSATDAGRGNNGICAVAVNGNDLANSFVFESSSISWIANITLAPGVNTIRVAAYDYLLNITRSTITLYYDTQTLPTEVLSPVKGRLIVKTIDEADPDKWVFNQHQSGAHTEPGICGADDMFAWDANLYYSIIRLH